MKTWIIPAVALSVLLASPAAMAAPSDQNAAAQQHQQDKKHSNAGQSKDKNRDVTVKRRVDVNRGVDVKRKVEVSNPHVVIKRPVEVNRNVEVRRHVDVAAIRRNVYSPRRYHWNVYRRPVGWYNHRWTYGQRLPRAWFVHDYWIGDFMMFGLIAPPYGYAWVRVGEDALLIDTETGEVVRVVYGVFY